MVPYAMANSPMPRGSVDLAAREGRVVLGVVILGVLPEAGVPPQY